MNLKPLFEMQKPLDDRIVKEKGLEGQDLLPKKILALQVELGELCNEWRGFKFWSNDQNPRTKVPITAWGEPYKNPLLEEYVDCLHFILSIGLEDKGFDDIYWINFDKAENITTQFNDLYKEIVDCFVKRKRLYFEPVIDKFLGLGEMLGFTWEQIEQAYMQKNAVNHERQDNGY